MRTLLRSIAVSGVLLAAVPAPPAAGADHPVVIRTYDASGLPEVDRAAALAAAAAILGDAGLAVAHLACDGVPGSATGHPCLVPLRAHELSLRLVRLPAPDPSAREMTLGYSLVETHRGAGSLATVYVDRVADLAAAAQVALSAILGRAIAHEIGHLLLGTTAHADVGVMRRVWSPEVLRRGATGDWRFTPRDAAALRAAARRRSAQPVPIW